MTIAVYFAGSAESYPLEHGDAVLDDCGLTDHDTKNCPHVPLLTPE